MLKGAMNTAWICRSCRQHLQTLSKQRRNVQRRGFSASQTPRQHVKAAGVSLDRVRNIGIIAHIDAGKTTTTERMLYYSGFTRRIGDVDDGSTVTDFLPAERARGITIQSAAITFHWPPKSPDAHPPPDNQYTINLIDTPGHADFTFEVIRSLRILDGAVCILDGVAGVEAQTEKVWKQANGYRIPRLIYVNKLDRDGAAFNRTVKEIASRLHTYPLLCHIPWWEGGEFIGIGDAVGLRALRWSEGGDGSTYKSFDVHELEQHDASFAQEVRNARTALVEALTEEDDQMVESFLEANEDWLAIPADTVWASIRRCTIQPDQAVTPVFAGASFRNIGVQPLLNAVTDLLPSPSETPDPEIGLADKQTTLRTFVSGETNWLTRALSAAVPAKSKSKQPALRDNIENILALGLAFKVVTDPRRGVLVYVRVYHGTLTRNSLLYNTNLGTSERSPRLLRMYASEAVEIDEISEGQIGVIAGLKQARTGDTLLVYQGLGANKPLPKPIDTLQLRPIDVPSPLFFTSVEPNSLAEEKNLRDSIALLLREDPSLSVNLDTESGQTHLSGMGELHLEIARDRLINDFKVKATMGKIEISYRETPSTSSSEISRTFDKEVAGKPSKASCTASIAPLEELDELPTRTRQIVKLTDGNILAVHHPALTINGQPLNESAGLPPHLPMSTIVQSLSNGVQAALARGSLYAMPVNSTLVRITFDHQRDLSPTSTSGAISSAARLAVSAALARANEASANAMMEPVMLATISMPESSMGSVIQDLSSSRGGQVLGLDTEEGDETGTGSSELGQVERLSEEKLARVYAPPDPFAADAGGSSGAIAIDAPRQIRARVPLKEMVGYLKHLRSMTGGRGTFIMSVDRYERMTPPRVKEVLKAMRGEYD